MKNQSNLKKTIVSSSLIFISLLFINACRNGNNETEKSGNVGNSTSVSPQTKSSGLSTQSEENVELY